MLSGEPEDKSKKGIILAVICIVAILLTVAVNILIFSPVKTGQYSIGERFLRISLLHIHFTTLWV